MYYLYKISLTRDKKFKISRHKIYYSNSDSFWYEENEELKKTRWGYCKSGHINSRDFVSHFKNASVSDPELWIVSEKENFKIPDEENTENEISIFFLTKELENINKNIEYTENSLSYYRERQKELAEKIKNLPNEYSNFQIQFPLQFV